jgi:hypothetical protein
MTEMSDAWKLRALLEVPEKCPVCGSTVYFDAVGGRNKALSQVRNNEAPELRKAWCINIECDWGMGVKE